MVIMLDGSDEISPLYKFTASSIMQNGGKTAAGHHPNTSGKGLGR
jgi:hypothetical protein